MDLKYSQIAQMARFSNDKMVDLIKTKLAESENAAAALVFDDKILVLDEKKEELYSVGYVVENRALNLSNWEKINLIPDNQTRIEEIAEAYFDPSANSEIRVKDLTEAFMLRYSNEPWRRLVNKAATEKKSIVESNSKIKALKKLREAREEYDTDISSIFEDAKIVSLMNSMSESNAVQNTVTYVDFKHPVSVSLFEEISDKVINLSQKKMTKAKSKNISKKVKNLWTSESFKQDLKDLVSEMKDGDSDELVESFIKDHSEILILKENELEDLVLKSALMIGEAAVSDSLSKLFTEHYNLNENVESRNSLLERNMINEEDGDGEEENPGFDLEGEEEKEPKEKESNKEKEEKETTIDEDSINKIVKVMNKIKGELEEKTLERKYVDSFIAALEDAKVGSIPEGKLKEILDFLNSVMASAKSKEEEEEE